MKKIVALVIISLLANCFRIKNVEKHLIYFSDKPYRISGHISRKNFMALWDKKQQDNSLLKVPFIKSQPSVAISYYDKEGKPHAALIEISNLKIGRDLVAETKVLNGNLPNSMHEVALFIDGLTN